MILKCPNCDTEQLQRVDLSKWRKLWKCRRCKWQMYLSPNYKEIKDFETVNNFLNKLIKNITDLPKEYSEIIDKNFWDLI